MRPQQPQHPARLTGVCIACFTGQYVSMFCHGLTLQIPACELLLAAGSVGGAVMTISDCAEGCIFPALVTDYQGIKV